MPFDDHSPNLAKSLVATAPSPATTGTSLVVTTGDGAKFPTPPFRAIIYDATQEPSQSNSEIVDVTAISTDTLTITRNASLATGDPDKQGSARTVVVGDKIAAVITARVIRVIETVLDITAKMGSLTLIGHSYLAGATQSDIGTAAGRLESLSSKLISLLGIHEVNTLNLGQAGTRIAGDGYDLATAPFGGWKGVFQWVVPNNAAIINAASDVVFSDPVVAVGGGAVIVHGCNDFLDGFDNDAEDDAVRVTHNNRAAKHAYRGILSRLRAGVLYANTLVAGTVTLDGTVTTSGSWSNLAQVTANSGGGIKYTTDFSGSATLTITIPLGFRGGIIAFALLGSPAGVSHITEDLDASETGVDVAERKWFLGAGTFVVKVDSEKMLVTAGNGTGAGTFTVTRGVGGTSAATHSNGAVIQTDDNNAKVAVSGTVFSEGSNPSHPDIVISGQGANNIQVCVVTRYTLTAADAGKTIVLTPGGLVTGDTSAFIGFDSWWIESPEPPYTVVTNVHDWEYGHKAFSTNAKIAAFNTMISDVVAEFDSYVKIADVHNRFWKRNGKLGNSGGVNNSATSFTFESNDTSFTPLAGTYFTFGRQSGEIVRVTAVSGSHPSWTLTVVRGQLGTSAASHSEDDWLGPMEWMHTDQVHLNIKGHAVYAETIFQAFNAMPIPSEYHIAQTVGNWAQGTREWCMGLIDNELLHSAVSAVTTLGTTLNLQYFVPIDIPRHCTITGIGVACTVDAGATLRYGIYLPDYTLSRPGRLLQEFGTISGAGIDANDGAAELTPVYQVVRPGYYWLSVVSQVAAASVRATTATGGGSYPPIQAITALGNANVSGYSRSGVSGAMSDVVPANLSKVNGGVPRIYIRVRTPTI